MGTLILEHITWFSLLVTTDKNRTSNDTKPANVLLYFDSDTLSPILISNSAVEWARVAPCIYHTALSYVNGWGMNTFTLQ